MRLTAGEGIEEGVYPTRKAIALADELGLDLVEIAAKANPPVCRIVDYNKFLYEQKMRQKEMKAKASKVVIKEIRLDPIQTNTISTLNLSMPRNFYRMVRSLKLLCFLKDALSCLKTKEKYYY